MAKADTTLKTLRFSSSTAGCRGRADSDFDCAEDRSQITLFPQRLENYVAEDNPVRVVDAFVDQLDLIALWFTRDIPRRTGHPIYRCPNLLNLYIYGSLNRVQSSRLPQIRSVTIKIRTKKYLESLTLNYIFSSTLNK